MVLAAIVVAAAVSLTPSWAGADTFGGQIHLLRSRGNLDGRVLSGAGGEATIPLPSSLTLHNDGDLVGGSLRGEFLLRGFRLGMGLDLFAVDALEHATTADDTLSVAPRRGFGFEHEVFVGYELLRGPFYGYLDLRATAGIVQVPVDLTSASSRQTIPVRYGTWGLGIGPRAGLLVPLGHSLMVDFAVYQHVVGGLEGTTAFVGLGYWENDRRDPFSERLRSGFTGDF